MSTSKGVWYATALPGDRCRRCTHYRVIHTGCGADSCCQEPGCTYIDSNGCRSSTPCPAFEEELHP
jgi:hypothetical protein